MVGYDVWQAIENSVFSACSDRGGVAESERLHYVFSICQQWCISGQSVTSWSGNETTNQRVVCWSILNVWTWYNVSIWRSFVILDSFEFKIFGTYIVQDQQNLLTDMIFHSTNRHHGDESKQDGGTLCSCIFWFFSQFGQSRRRN